ncbi:MAG: ATP-binding protein [Acidimicrobiia bacterium]|nr:ATP-binding protein [Acidimicrobiia bacterium]
MSIGSLRSRLLLVAIAVALIAVMATALIAQRVASDDLRSTLDSDLQTDNDVVSDLNSFLVENGSWNGVSALVTSLADREQERIALTDDAGRIIADSDPEANLPSQPTGIVNARSLFDDELEDEAEERCEEIADDDDDDDREDGSFDQTIYEECIDLEVARLALATTGLPATAFVYVGEGDDDASSILGEDGPDARLVIVALIVLAGAAGLMALALRPVLAPIDSLRSGAQRLGAGDLSARVPTQGATELVELANSFNHMADSLEADDERRRRWTSDVAHELRSPLQNLRGQLEAASDGLMDTDEAWFESMVDEVGQLGHVVDDLQVLTLSDAGQLTLELQPLDVGSVAVDVVTAHEARAQAGGVALTASGSGVAEIDGRRMRQILGNLVDNALRHTPSGGTIEIEVVRSSDDVAVTVVDSGDGIPDDQLGRIFDRFARADEHRGRATGGTGLGLAIVAALVDAHGGSVEIDSEMGVGTTCVVVLPAVHQP